MSDLLWTVFILHIIFTVVIFGIATFEWADSKDGYGSHYKDQARMNARIMALSPVWSVAALCYIAYKVYTLYPSFIKDVKGR